MNIDELISIYVHELKVNLRKVESVNLKVPYKTSIETT